MLEAWFQETNLSGACERNRVAKPRGTNQKRGLVETDGVGAIESTVPDLRRLQGLRPDGLFAMLKLVGEQKANQAEPGIVSRKRLVRRYRVA